MQGLPAGAPKPMPPNPSAPYFSTNASYPNNQMQQYAQPRMNPGTLYSQGGYGNQYNSLNGRVGYTPPSYPNQPPYYGQQPYGYENNDARGGNLSSQSSNISQSGPSFAKQDRQIDKDLREACGGNGNLELVKSYLRAGADVNSADSKGDSPLHYAAEWGRVDIVEYLSVQVANINPINNKGWTPLALAIGCGKLEAADILFNKGARKIGDKNILSSQTALGKALVLCNCCGGYGKLEMVKIAIDTGADINSTDSEGYSPLHYAAEWGRVDIVEYLTANYATIDAINDEGKTSLAKACQENKTTCVNVLLRRGADPNKILPSVYEGLSKDIKHILYLHLEQNKGRPASVAAPASSAISPLNEACKSGNLDEVRQAIRNGDRPDTRTLTMACWSKNLQIIDAVRAVDAKPDNKTLTTACSTGIAEIVRKARDAGAEPTKETYDIAQQVGNHILNLLPRKKD